MTAAAVRREHLLQAMTAAATIAGRSLADIDLIAVSKTHGADEIIPLIDAGQRHFGESRIQEAQSKWPALFATRPDLRLHLIGQLQSNKAAAAVALFDTIHSLDRPSLLDALVKAGEQAGRFPDVYIQVNIGEEEQKGGISIADLPAFIKSVRSSPLKLRGLMAIPPAELEPGPYFALVAKLARRHDVTGLSMGMSADFESAIMLGATVVRVGTAMFAERT